MKYQNIQINFENNLHEEMIGDAYFVFNESATEFLLNYYANEEDLDYSIQEALGNSDSELHVHDIDAYLSLMYCIIEHGDQNSNYSVTAAYSHIIWLFHDLSHIRYDCSENSVTVYQWNEERAIRASIKLCEENNIPVPWSVVGEISQAFKKRFGSELVLSDGMDTYIDYSKLTFKELE